MKQIKAYENKEVMIYTKPETVKILTKGTPKEKGELFNNLGKLIHYWDSGKKWFKDNEKNKSELSEFKEEAEKQIKELLEKAGYSCDDKKEKEQYIHFAICGVNMHQIPLYDGWNTDITPYLFNTNGQIKPLKDMLKSFYEAKGINPEKQEAETLEEFKELDKEQQKAVKEMLKEEGEELSDITEIEEHDDGLFIDFGYKSYLIMTDGEAQERAEAYIKSSVWAFNADFLLSYMPDGMTTDAIKAIQGQYEDANEPLTGMIKDIDEFIEDAINADGRGHFLSSYDGEESELSNDYFYIREG